MQPFENLERVTEVVHTILAPNAPLWVTRVTEGGSTLVYRIRLGEETFYLRVWPEAAESFAPELATHQQLRALGLRVPAILHFEPYNAVLDRSLLLTHAIPGRALGYHDQPAATPQIVLEAGRELALINQVVVQGYGWLRRDRAKLALVAEFPTLPMWLHAHFTAPLQALAQSNILPTATADQLLNLLALVSQLYAAEPALLAHGDFDTTHIFYAADRYTGIIDFGEIRGAHRFYDLAHFAIENSTLLPYLLAGYRERITLPDDILEHIHLFSLLIAARRIGRRVLQARAPHDPDIAFVQQHLPKVDAARRSGKR